MSEDITPEDWDQLQKTYDENEDMEPKYTKHDLLEAYKQSAYDGGWKDDDEELELFFEKWFEIKFGTFDLPFSDMERGS